MSLPTMNDHGGGTPAHAAAASARAGTEAARLPLSFARDGARFGAVVALHFVVAAIYKEIAGVTIVPESSFDWSASWHLMPWDLLRSNLLGTLWDLHAQPPLYNLWCGVFIKLFGNDAIAFMHYPQIVLGASISGMVYVILRQFLGNNQRLAFGVASMLAFNPALVLFEAELGYDLLTAFWATLGVFFLALFYSAPRVESHATTRRLVYLVGFLTSLNLLILTRSLFHPVLLLAAIPFACVAAGTRWRSMLAVALIVSVSSVGWYAKNYARFGFFGGSSWAGQNLWTNASANYDRRDLQQFIDNGVIEPTVLSVLVWNRPAAYRPYGFDKTSSAETLARNNYNNINVVEISKMYGRNAARLMWHRPLHYAVNVAKAYRIFCMPTSRTKYVQDNAARMGWHESLVSQVVQGQYFTGLLATWFRKDPFLSFWFFVIPASLAAYVLQTCRRRGRSRADWLALARTDGVLLFTAILIVYTSLVACTFDYGENGRFRFAIEPLLWPFVIAVAYRTMRRAS